MSSRNLSAAGRTKKAIWLGQKRFQIDPPTSPHRELLQQIRMADLCLAPAPIEMIEAAGLGLLWERAAKDYAVVKVPERNTLESEIKFRSLRAERFQAMLGARRVSSPVLL